MRHSGWGYDSRARQYRSFEPSDKHQLSMLLQSSLPICVGFIPTIHFYSISTLYGRRALCTLKLRAIYYHLQPCGPAKLHIMTSLWVQMDRIYWTKHDFPSFGIFATKLHARHYFTWVSLKLTKSRGATLQCPLKRHRHHHSIYYHYMTICFGVLGWFPGFSSKLMGH